MKRWFIVLGISIACVQAPSPASDVSEVNAGAIMQQALSAYQRSDFEGAIKYLSARARMAPEDPNVYYYLGNCYVKTNQTDNAARMYSTCIRKSPTSQAGQFSLSALESISTMPKTPRPPETPPPPDPAATAAVKESLVSERALDKAFNEAAERIRNQRQSLKVKVDHVWEDLQQEMSSLSPKNTSNYAAEMERLQREAENEVLAIHTKELRYESRLLAPDKIDVRAVPELPEEKKDDTKTALGSLMQYFNPEKPYDPFGAEITPEMTSKFMSIRDVFGELSTYTPQARKLARQVFFQLKSNIESKQDQLDIQVAQARSSLIRDIVNVKISYGNVNIYSSQSAQSYLTSSKIPRSKQTSMTPAEIEVSQATERAKKRMLDLKDSYMRDVDGLIAGAKEKVGGIVIQTGQMNTQLKKPSGTIQLVPVGTDAYTRNYVNFGERAPKPQPSATSTVTGQMQSGTGKAATVQPLRAEAKKLQPKSSTSSKVKGQ